MMAVLRRLAAVWAALGVVLLLLAALLFNLNQQTALPVQVAVGLGGSLLLGAVVLRPDFVQRTLAGRRVKYGSNVLVMTLAFFGILTLVNILANRHPARVDLTEMREFTLSPQSARVLQNLDRPVRIIGFYQGGDPREQLVRDLLSEYQVHTQLISFEFHDPDLEPRLASQYQPTNYGALIFLSAGRRYESFGTDEQTLSSALVRVTSDEQKGIYFVTGHGERQLDDYDPEGMGLIRQVLERENYRAQEMNLALLKAGLPQDTAVVVVAGPKREYFERELDLLRVWLEEGGRLMLLYEPGAPVPLAGDLKAWGVTVGDDVIVDPPHGLIINTDEGEVVLEDVLLLQDYPFHPITRDLTNFLTYFPAARSIRVEPGDGATKPNAQPLVSTGPKSWGEVTQDAEMSYDPTEDDLGPLHLGVAIEDFDHGARLIVFGDSDFVDNQSVQGPVANIDLFVNSVNWLADDEDMISIRPRPRVNRQLRLLPMQRTFILNTVVVVLPLLFVTAGVAVWWRRR
jgi:hypothetical protein